MNQLIKNLQQSIVLSQQKALENKIDAIDTKLCGLTGDKYAEIEPIHIALMDVRVKLHMVNLTDIQLIEIDTAILKINRLI